MVRSVSHSYNIEFYAFFIFCFCAKTVMMVVVVPSPFLHTPVHTCFIYEAGKSRENASKYVRHCICENWCDTKSVVEGRDCADGNFGSESWARCNFGSESGVKGKFWPAIARERACM